MSQWGKTRTFTRGKAIIRVIPDIVGAAVFSPAGGSDKIASVDALDFFGPTEECETLLSAIRSRYEGRQYQEWFSLAPSDDGSIGVVGVIAASTAGKWNNTPADPAADTGRFAILEPKCRGPCDWPISECPDGKCRDSGVCRVRVVPDRAP